MTPAEHLARALYPDDIYDGPCTSGPQCGPCLEKQASWELHIYQIGEALKTMPDDTGAIVKQWTDRCHHQSYSKRVRMNRQADFFAGAMAARNVAGMENWCPANWYVSILRGDLIT